MHDKKRSLKSIIKILQQEPRERRAKWTQSKLKEGNNKKSRKKSRNQWNGKWVTNKIDGKKRAGSLRRLKKIDTFLVRPKKKKERRHKLPKLRMKKGILQPYKHHKINKVILQITLHT